MEKQRESVASMQASILKQRDALGLKALEVALPAAAVADVPCLPLPAHTVTALVGNAARRHRVAPDVLRQVMRQESAYKPCAVSPKGAMGLMQLMPATADQLGVRDPFDPEANTEGGARFLGELLARYGGNLRLALAAYNAGPARLDGATEVPPIPETREYVRRILAAIEPSEKGR